MVKQVPNERITTEDAIAFFDSLEPAEVDMMIGDWKGEGVDTGHPMDGMLEATNWYGKRFNSANDVHPLIHRAPWGGTVSIDPTLMPLRLALNLPFRDALAPALFPLLCVFFRANKGKARLRAIEFRGRLHAAMCYDTKPINDVFAKISDNAVLGWMDYKGMEKPYFFKLTRKE